MNTQGFEWSEYPKIEFDKTLNQELLDLDSTRRTNPFRWRGQFSPDFVNYLLKTFETNGVIVDPFCGSGTTLIEASFLGKESYGVEGNPAAYILSRFYQLTNLSQTERETINANTKKGLENLSLHSEDTPISLDMFANWVKEVGDEEKWVRDLIALLSFGNTSKTTRTKVESITKKVLGKIKELPEGDLRVELRDARSLGLEDSTASMVLTSPPYVNVFNYHQNYRKIVEALGWEVLSYAKSELGANRKFRSNRFLTISQYSQDLGQVVAEADRILKPFSKSIWVVGRESKVLGTSVPNSLILYEVATKVAGWKLKHKLERSFISQYGQTVFEDILVFETNHSKAIKGKESGRQVGERVLETLWKNSGKSEIEEALKNVGKVRTSPLVVE